MSYPQIIEYNEAIQDPRSAFSDAELKRGTVEETPLGLPLALSGGFALTYTVKCAPKKFAIRCFHREVPEAQSRYAAISAKLGSLTAPYFVSFDFQSVGIRVRGKSFPIVKMDWVEGRTLGVHLDANSGDRAAVGSLRQAFVSLADFLERNGVAHGDIQNENVIIANGALKLIDYDGMFVSGMQVGRGTEVGHKHFQHPGREPKHFGPQMDRFSFIVIDVSLEALQSDPSLHRRFREGGTAIIFKANDFADPSSSDVFRTLEGMSALRESALKLAAVCSAPISDVPSLSDFIAGRNIPTAPPRTERASGAPRVKQAYIGAFDVLDGKDFHAVMRRVGHNIELVGKIVSVKRGIGKRGRGRGKPYVFINFGAWNKESVKITIWSEGLSNIGVQPDDKWVGKWISVTGLVEPPYEGQHYGRPYKNVGIAVVSGNQIIPVSEQEAKFRLGFGGKATRKHETPGMSTNQDILKGIRNENTGAQTSTSSRTRQPQSTPTRANPTTRNQSILGGIHSSTPPTSRTIQHPSRITPRSSSGLQIPPWLWVLGAIVLLVFLLRKK